MKCLALSFALTCPLLSTVHGADWPQWRGPNYNGISSESIPPDLPEELPVAWKTKVGTGFATVSVASNRVLTMGNVDEHDIVSCIDAESGAFLWQFQYPCPLDPLYYEGGPGGTPTIHGDSVYTLSKKGHAFRLSLETGEVIWKRDLLADHDFDLPEWSFACSPFISDNRILLNVGRNGLALDRETGKTLWAPATETSGYATVVPYGDHHLLFSAKALIAFREDDGKVVWEFPWKSSRDVNAADPVVIGDRILLSSSSGTSLLEIKDGQPMEVWKQHDKKWYFNPGVTIDGHSYSIHGTTHRPTELMCTNLETGEIVWAEEGYGSGGLVAAGNTVIVFDNGVLTLFEASPAGFKPIHRQTVLEGKCWTSPVISHGRIYCRNAEGDLACVRLRQ